MALLVFVDDNYFKFLAAAAAFTFHPHAAALSVRVELDRHFVAAERALDADPPVTFGLHGAAPG